MYRLDGPAKYTPQMPKFKGMTMDNTEVTRKAVTALLMNLDVVKSADPNKIRPYFQLFRSPWQLVSTFCYPQVLFLRIGEASRRSRSKRRIIVARSLSISIVCKSMEDN